MVIIGGGIVGCSLADELTERGWTDVTVLEQGPLPAPGGSTSHAPGLVQKVTGNKTLAAMADQTINKLLTVSNSEGPGFYQVGSLEVATTPQRLKELHRRTAWLQAYGYEAEVVSPERAAELHPVLDPTKILGAIHCPTDGIAKAVRAVEALQKIAESRGAVFKDRHEVISIEQEGGKVIGVTTDQGFFPAEIVVSCAGIWGPKVGRMFGMTKAFQPLAHQLAWTEDIPSLANQTEEITLPIMRHQGEDLYFRQRFNHMGIGSYLHRPLPVESEEILPFDQAEVMPSQLPFTAPEWAPVMDLAGEIMPELKNAKITEGMNGMFSFTVDTFPLMGEWNGLKGFWVAEAVWVTHSVGVARATAEWIIDGHPKLAVHECDVNRFEPHQLGPNHISMRGAQNYVEVYDIIHPLQPMEKPRPLRTTGFYHRQQELGGYFLEASGYERPHWYECNKDLVAKYPSPARDDWSAQYWSPIVGAEAQYVRENVGLFDITALKRIEVSGKGALEFLMEQTTGKLDKAPGSVTYCLMLTKSAGILSDVTVTRLGENEFMIGANGAVDVARLQKVAPDTVFVKDVTAGTVGLGVFGPNARKVIEKLTKVDVSNEAFGYFKAKSLYLDQVPATLWRLSYVGELGYEIYTDADMALKLWDTLLEAGKEFGIIPAGRGAFNSMRLEKGYRSYGTDMTSEHNPHEAGLAFSVRKGGGYIGADAFEALDPAAISRKLVCLVFDNPEHVVMGKEPVFVAGVPAGYTTSSYFGHSIGKQIAYAWLPIEHTTLGTQVSVKYFDSMYPAVVSDDPQFDASMSRLRS
ncbi:MAG: FAD-dependent oxidoreductase [Actinobacteria bacterium]|nr:FAD-dependent oxidoreductase [Actinomycetota bacterium]MSX30246.1 FAD-dependent oxidoreductase [Actinomycetota bacterium]MSX97352.1 FAD-dependent oxidoreductase [Actinomycetota bacterium]MSZ79793.1 FAD-dependent oxidoreductase [Actinomycetota bacterium]